MNDKYTTLVFLVKDNEVLLAMKKRGFGQGRWNGVGGKIEPTETLDQAIIRETQEEINVTPLSYTKVAEHDFLMDSDTKPWHMYVHTYICDQWEGDPQESEEMKPQWYKKDEIPFDTMWQDDPYWLPQVLRGEKVVGKYRFNSNDDFVSHTVTTVDTLPHSIPTRL